MGKFAIRGSPKINQGELEIAVYGSDYKNKIGRVGLKEVLKIEKSINKSDDK